MKKILEVIVLENGDLGFGIQWSTLGHHKLQGKYNGVPLGITILNQTCRELLR